MIFIMDDICDTWNQLTDVQKAELRKRFAEIRLDNTKKIFSICKIDYDALRSFTI